MPFYGCTGVLQGNRTSLQAGLLFIARRTDTLLAIIHGGARWTVTGLA